MLILGIETATEQVSVAIGGHEGVLAMFEVCRGRRHAETLIPSIEFVCKQADIQMSDRRIAVESGQGVRAAVGLAAAKQAQLCESDDRDQFARPPGVPMRRVVGGSGSDRRPQGRVVLPFYRPVPGGVQASASTCGSVETWSAN